MIGLVVLLVAIMACGIEASLVPAMTGTPVTPVEPSTVTLVLKPAPTSTSRPTPTAGAMPAAFSPEPENPALEATATVAPTATCTLTPTLSPTISATSLPPTSTDTATPEPAGITPQPTLQEVSGTEQVGYRYHPIGPAQPDLSQPCPGCPRAPGYITGRVVDAGGNPLPGVRLVCYNDWHRYPVVGSKGGGEYDFPILQAAATWYVVILDEADQPLSPAAPVQFDPLEACWYRLDWQRID